MTTKKTNTKRKVVKKATTAKKTIQKPIVLGNPRKAFDLANRKIDNFYYGIKIYTSSFQNVADIRLYSKGSTTYCCFWLWGKKNISGSGSVSGYGYDKESAAINDAFYNAGFSFNGANSFSGAGMKSAIDTTLKVLKFLGEKGKLHVIEMRG